MKYLYRSGVWVVYSFLLIGVFLCSTPAAIDPSSNISEYERRERHVVEMRSDLPMLIESMNRGINTDADSDRRFFTGYSWKTVFDWDRYFESIIQMHVGWKSEFAINGVKIFLESRHVRQPHRADCRQRKEPVSSATRPAVGVPSGSQRAKPSSGAGNRGLGGEK